MRKKPIKSYLFVFDYKEPETEQEITNFLRDEARNENSLKIGNCVLTPDIDDAFSIKLRFDENIIQVSNKETT